MSSVNKVILIGFVGQDPEINHSQNGGRISNFSLATTEKWKDKDSGEPREKTEWHRLVAYNQIADVIGNYVKKGSKLYIEGKLQTRKWQGQDGVERYTTEIVVQPGGLTMLDSPNQGQQQRPQQAPAQQAPQQAPAQQAPQQAPAQQTPQQAPEPQNNGFQDFDDDIPF